MIGIGIDLVSIERMERALQNPRFAGRVFTEGERKRFEQGAESLRRIEGLAGVFAAKEAVAKALGSGFSGGITLHDIEILRDEGAGPRCLLHRKAKERLAALGGVRVLVSVTHEKAMAAAVAVIL